MRAVAGFLYTVTGLRFVVSALQSFVFRYQLRVRMVPVSYKLFVFVIGSVFGGSVVFVHLSFPSLVQESAITFEQKARVPEAKAETVKVETVEETIRRVAGDFPEVETLVKVAFCESSFDRLAENKTSSAKGVFQILDMHGLSATDRFNVEKSTQWAVDTIEKHGFKPWQSSKHCWAK